MNKPERTNIYQSLRKQIISMQRKPGASLDEKSLAQEFGGSRTPVREALIRLSADGIVEIKKNKGARVAPLDIESLRAIFEARSLLEKAITKLACLRRNQQDLKALQTQMQHFASALKRQDVGIMAQSSALFNLAIAAAANNKYFYDCYRRILMDHERIAQLWYQHNFEQSLHKSNAAITEQQKAIYAAIDAQDTRQAASVCKLYADQCKDGVQAIIHSGDSYLSDVGL